MLYQVDQSGKVEDTSKLTIVCVAGKKIKTLKIYAREKRRLITTMRRLDYPKKIFIYKIFAALVFILIKEEKIDNLSIDKEYPGHEGFIKEIIFQFFKKVK